MLFNCKIILKREQVSLPQLVNSDKSPGSSFEADNIGGILLNFAAGQNFYDWGQVQKFVKFKKCSSLVIESRYVVKMTFSKYWEKLFVVSVSLEPFHPRPTSQHAAGHHLNTPALYDSIPVKLPENQ